MDPRYKSPTANVDREVEDEFRDLETFTAVLRWMLIGGAAMSLLGIVSSTLQLQLLSQPFTEEEGRANDMRELAVAGVTTLLSIGTLVVFGRWIVLAHRNLNGLGIRHTEFTPGWALGWFFIPIANLWKPYQAMRFLWRASHSVQRHELQESTWVLPTWWTLWLISSYVGNFLLRAAFGPNTVEALASMTRIAIANGVVDVPLYIVASVLVSRTWAAQRTQRENPGEFDPAPGFADT